MCVTPADAGVQNALKILGSTYISKSILFLVTAIFVESASDPHTEYP